MNNEATSISNKFQTMATKYVKANADSHHPPSIHLHSNNSTIQNSEEQGRQGGKSSSDSFPCWYSPETGIYRSTHPSVQLPTDPFLDVVSFIFSHKHGGASSLVDSQSGFSISYPELYSLVKSMAGGLHKMGVSQGDAVLILLPNSIHFPVIVLSVLSLGAIVVPMNPLSTLFEVKKQALDGMNNICLAFSSLNRAEEFSALGIPVIGLPESSNLDFPAGSVFGDLIRSDLQRTYKPRIKQEDTAAILFSSGTTGACKGVVLTHRNFIAMVELFLRFEASQYDYDSRKNVYLDVVPMFHVYGLSMFVMGLLSLGSTVVVMGRCDGDEVVRAIERFGVTHFPIAPPLLRTLTLKAKAATAGGINRVVMKSMKQVSCGAAPTSLAWIQDFVQTLPHIDFIQGYGMTESTAVGTRGYNTAKLHNYSSVGLLAPNMEAKVVDWNTSLPSPPNCKGELWLRGPSIMKGYQNNVEATKSTIDDEGWLHTGDIVYFDCEGYLYVNDRLKEIIKYKGFQIAPADLEAVLISHPDIIDAGVTSASEDEVGEIPVAFVVKRNNSELSEADVIAFVAQQVAPYKKVRRVYFTTSIPKSPTGKILRKEMRKFMRTSKL